MENNEVQNGENLKKDLNLVHKKLIADFDKFFNKIEESEDEIFIRASEYMNDLVERFDELEYKYQNEYNRELKIEFFKIYRGLIYLRDELYSMRNVDYIDDFCEDLDYMIDAVKAKFPEAFDELKNFIEFVDKNGVEV